jgi:hypothetical protein
MNVPAPYLSVVMRLALAVPIVLASCATQAPSPSSAHSTAPIVGVWTRTQDCESMLEAFRLAGIADARSDWIDGIWRTDATSHPSNPCANALPARPHTIFFAAGGFGTYAANGNRSIETEYRIQDADTIVLEPRPGGDYQHALIVDYVIDGDEATFTIEMPPGCPSDFACSAAYAWALSHLYGDAWHRE